MCGFVVFPRGRGGGLGRRLDVDVGLYDPADLGCPVACATRHRVGALDLGGGEIPRVKVVSRMPPDGAFRGQCLKKTWTLSIVLRRAIVVRPTGCEAVDGRIAIEQTNKQTNKHKKKKRNGNRRSTKRSIRTSLGEAGRGG